MSARKALLPGWLLAVHRWLGIVVGAVMTLWCLSGFVMLYVEYPRLLPAEQLRGLPRIEPPFEGLDRVPLAADTAIASARIEMAAGKVVLRIVPERGEGRAIWQVRATPLNYDLKAGVPLAPFTQEEIGRIAADFAEGSVIDAAVAATTPIEVDQWTVQAFRANRPLVRVDYADAARSSIYIAALSGEVVQQTTRFERVWSWLGAVPHWLYPTLLRQNPAVWTHVVIWTSLAGSFLTATGLWIGVARLRCAHGGTMGSPYRGLWWWHHMAGLVFGLITLTWVASGLLSMNPLGVFDTDVEPAERRRLAGTMRWAELRSALAQVQRLPAGTVRLGSAPLDGHVALVASGRDGHIARLDNAGRPALLTRTDVLRALRKGPRIASMTLLREGDSYYYAHKVPVQLPVWRAVQAEPHATRLYIDASSGTLVRAVDGAARAERWLWTAPHSFDLPGLRGGVLRSLVLVPLLAAVTLVCATGVWMGLRKLARDGRRLRRRHTSSLSRSRS